jgi:uncharacterized glyoxalase superfamily protein PhnB
MAPSKLRDVAVVLPVGESRSMIAYFVERLGFRLQGSVGDLPSWASLERDGSEVMIICGNHPAPATDWAAYFYVDDADTLYKEYVGRSADLASPPTDKPYGLREFEVRLPDGRLLAFGGAIPTP